VVVLTLATPHIGIAMTMIAILSGQVGKRADRPFRLVPARANA
jgi:hypothetical protein